MDGRFALRSIGSRIRRRPLLSTLMVAGLVVVPGAIAWACVPSAAIGFDSPSYTYAPGQTVTVTGRQWRPGSNVSLNMAPNPGVTIPGARADEVGFWRTSFTLPANTAPGTYNVVATGDDGRVAREAFQVQAGAPAATRQSQLAAAHNRCKRKYSTKGRRGEARRRQVSRRQACIKRATRRINAGAS